MIQETPENIGILPSQEYFLTGSRKQAINPLRTVLNNTFTREFKQQLKNPKKIDFKYIEEHQKGIIEAYTNCYGEKGKQFLQQEMENTTFSLAKGLAEHEGKSPRSIPITQEQWDKYITNGGYEDHVFNCEARPDILVFDFDYELTKNQLQKIQKAFKKYLWVIEKNTEKGTSHLYIQCDDDTTITKVKAGIRENEEDKEPLDIDIFKGRKGYVCGASPSRPYQIIYDKKPEKKINTKKAIILLSEALGCYLDKNVLEEIVQPQQKHERTTTTTTTPEGEITVTSNNPEETQRQTIIIENAIPIFKKVAGNHIREELYKGLSGALLRHGFNNNSTKEIMTQIYNNTDDEDPRLTTVENAINRYQNGEKTNGWTVFSKKVNEQNNNKRRLGKYLENIGNAIFQHEPKTIERINPKTKTIEKQVMITDTAGQNSSMYEEIEEDTEGAIISKESEDITKYEVSSTNNHEYTIIIDYKKLTISRKTLKRTKKGLKEEYSLIITAVPLNLVVYNDIICNTGRQYQCTWLFNDDTEQEIVGDVPLHTKTLLKGAGVWNKTQLQNTISAVFGDLTRTKANNTTIKNTPQQKGFYYDKKSEEIIPVDHEITRPTKKQLKEALEFLEEYHNSFGYLYFNKDEPEGEGWIKNTNNPEEKVPTFKVDADRLAVFLRWCLNAPFHYVRKQYGLTNDKYIFLSGESGVGKTYGYLQAGLFMLGVEEPKEFIVSGGSNSKAQISKNLAKTTFPVLIDEGDHIFNEENLTSILKHSVQGLYSRDVTDMDTNRLVKEPALAPLGFSANNNFDDTEKGGLTNRVIILPFYTRDIPTTEAKQGFEEVFHTYYTPEDRRRILKWIGYEFQARILENPEVYKQRQPDRVVKQFFEDICQEVEYTAPLEWINNDINQTTAEDELKRRHNELMDTIHILLNKEMKRTLIKEDKESLSHSYLIEDDQLTPEERILYLAESNKISWLYTNKYKKYLVITEGIITAIKRQNPKINVKTLAEFRDLLLIAKHGIYDIKRYSINVNGESKQERNSLKIDVEVFSELYEYKELEEN